MQMRWVRMLVTIGREDSGTFRRTRSEALREIHMVGAQLQDLLQPKLLDNPAAKRTLADVRPGGICEIGRLACRLIRQWPGSLAHWLTHPLILNRSSSAAIWQQQRVPPQLGRPVVVSVKQ